MNILDRNLKRFFHTSALDRAQLRLKDARQDQRQVTKKANADGTITQAEQARIADAKLVTQAAKANVAVQATQQERQQFTKKARASGGLDKAEKAHISALNNEIDQHKQARASVRAKDPALFAELDKARSAPTDFRIGSFNVTGSSHTKPGGEHPEFESGRKRMHYAAKAIAEHKLDIVGFQELQADQLNEFQKVTNHRFGVYPGVKLGKRESVNSIAWDKSKWDLVKGSTIGIPYFNGTKRQMPVVLLRNKQTGQRAFFTNFHNPADTRRFHQQEKFRDAATRLEIALVNKLRKQTGLPVFLTGDMNEKQEYGQHMTAGTEMESAHKGKDSHSNSVGIDWIFGSSDVAFSDFRKDRSALIRKTTNHPLIFSNARIRANAKR